MLQIQQKNWKEKRTGTLNNTGEFYRHKDKLNKSDTKEYIEEQTKLINAVKSQTSAVFSKHKQY